MLKTQLLAEANEKIAGVAVELDGIFESVELSDEVKASFSTVFEQVVKAKAVELAESHLNSMAEIADAKVVELTEAGITDVKTKLYEDADKFLTHIGEEWLKENKVAVDNGIKSRMVESMVLGLKELFVEHNIVVPEDQVNVVEELEVELDESKVEIKSLFDKNIELTEEVNSLKQAATLKEATTELTESQKEKVLSLVEGLDYNDTYSTKLSAIVEMVVASTQAVVEESAININESAAGANFEPEQIQEETKQEVNPMAKYLSAATRLA